MPQIPLEDPYLLGQTGETVVYVFPSGDALMDRDREAAPHYLAQHPQAEPAQPPATPASPNPDQPAREEPLSHSALNSDLLLIDTLLAQGKLTPAQVQVGRHDQQVTGLSLLEALITRGWLTLETLQPSPPPADGAADQPLDAPPPR